MNEAGNRAGVWARDTAGDGAGNRIGGWHGAGPEIRAKAGNRTGHADADEPDDWHRHGTEMGPKIGLGMGLGLSIRLYTFVNDMKFNNYFFQNMYLHSIFFLIYTVRDLFNELSIYLSNILTITFVSTILTNLFIIFTVFTTYMRINTIGSIKSDL